MSKLWVFGYGSLLNLASVHDTVPEIKALRPCFIKGFKRDFSFWAPTGYVTTNLDVAGIPFYALNVTASEDIDTVVNGVMFEVDDQQFEKLAVREHGYDLVQTVAYDYQTSEALHDCIVYSAIPHLDEPFDIQSPAQLRYLQICLTGAQSHGARFYRQFRETTLIQDKTLADLNL